MAGNDGGLYLLIQFVAEKWRVLALTGKRQRQQKLQPCGTRRGFAERLRFCSADGTMEFVGSKGTEAGLSGYLRWFDVPDRRTRDVTVVFGYWSTLGLTLRPDLISLDTGYLWGELTAVCLEDRSVLQVDCPQYRQPGSV